MLENCASSQNRYQFISESCACTYVMGLTEAEGWISNTIMEPRHSLHNCISRCEQKTIDY